MGSSDVVSIVYILGAIHSTFTYSLMQTVVLIHGKLGVMDLRTCGWFQCYQGCSCAIWILLYSMYNGIEGCCRVLWI